MTAEHPHAFYLQMISKRFSKNKRPVYLQVLEMSYRKACRRFSMERLEHLLIIQRKTSTKSFSLKTIQAPKKSCRKSLSYYKIFLPQKTCGKYFRKRKPPERRLVEVFYRKISMGRTCRRPFCFRRPLENISAIEDLQIDWLTHRRRDDILVSKEFQV